MSKRNEIIEENTEEEEANDCIATGKDIDHRFGKRGVKNKND